MLPERPAERVAVVGLGLIGGSLLRRLTGRFAVVGHDSDPATRRAAGAGGAEVAATPPDAVAGADLVVLAVPLPAVGPVLREIAPAARPGAVLTDVVSVKGPVREAVRALAPELRYVGGHPMAGTARSGFAASDPGLFAGAAWVLCLEEDTDLPAWLDLAGLVTGLGCRVVPCSAAEHDDAVARISGLPHVLAATLAATGAAGGPLALALAAGSFRDATRVAGTRPELSTALCEGNRAALEAALDEQVRRLEQARAALRGGAGLGGLFALGHAARHRLDSLAHPGTPGTPGTTSTAGEPPGEPPGEPGEPDEPGEASEGREWRLSATDPALRDRLGALGRAGGHVAAVTGQTLLCRRPTAETVAGPPQVPGSAGISRDQPGLAGR